MFFVRDEIGMLSVPLSFDLTDDQIWVSKYNQRFDSQVNCSFETEDTSFILNHVFGTAEAESGGERVSQLCFNVYWVRSKAVQTNDMTWLLFNQTKEREPLIG